MVSIHFEIYPNCYWHMLFPCVFYTWNIIFSWKFQALMNDCCSENSRCNILHTVKYIYWQLILFPLILVQIRIVFQTVLYEYGNLAAMIFFFKKNLLLCCNPTVDGQLFLHEFYKMCIVDRPLYPYIVDVCLWLICYGLYKFETTVVCSTLLFSLGTYISFSSLFLEYYKGCSKFVVLLVYPHLYLIYHT